MGFFDDIAGAIQSNLFDPVNSFMDEITGRNNYIGDINPNAYRESLEKAYSANPFTQRDAELLSRYQDTTAQGELDRLRHASEIADALKRQNAYLELKRMNSPLVESENFYAGQTPEQIQRAQNEIQNQLGFFGNAESVGRRQQELLQSELERLRDEYMSAMPEYQNQINQMALGDIRQAERAANEQAQMGLARRGLGTSGLLNKQELVNATDAAAKYAQAKAATQSNLEDLARQFESQVTQGQQARNDLETYRGTQALESLLAQQRLNQQMQNQLYSSLGQGIGTVAGYYAGGPSQARSATQPVQTQQKSMESQEMKPAKQSEPKPVGQTKPTQVTPSVVGSSAVLPIKAKISNANTNIQNFSESLTSQDALKRRREKLFAPYTQNYGLIGGSNGQPA